MKQSPQKEKERLSNTLPKSNIKEPKTEKKRGNSLALEATRWENKIDFKKRDGQSPRGQRFSASRNESDEIDIARNIQPNNISYLGQSVTPSNAFAKL